MAAYLVRHAKAGSRETWEGDDQDRPLTKAGRKQAEWLVERLGKRKIAFVFSSPYKRCVHTVKPLAEELGLSVETDPKLIEGSGPKRAMKLMEKHADDGIVICTHGDVMLESIELTLRPIPDNVPVGKGGYWLLELKGNKLSATEYFPPPSGS